METLRLSARRLRQRPAATIAAIATLACAIAATAATWSLLSAVAAGAVAAARHDLAAVLLDVDASINPGPVMTLQEQIGRQMSVQPRGRCTSHSPRSPAWPA